MKIGEWIESGRARVSRAPITCRDPRLHLQQILQAVSGWTLAEIYVRWEETLPAELLEKLEAFLRRRLEGEPFQYMVGHEGFWSSQFKVGPGVLIPRRETELLVEAVLKISTGSALKVGELGAGSGNIGISVLLENPTIEWHAFELNPESIPYLKSNGESLLPKSRGYHIHEGDFFRHAESFAPYDLIVSNPPYIDREDLSKLDTEIHHEPRLALDGGAQGIEVLASLASASQRLLKDNGIIITEIGSTQQEVVEKLFSEAGFLHLETLRDLSGLPRAIMARKGNGDGRTDY